MAGKNKKKDGKGRKNQEVPLPDDGIVLCFKCGATVDLNEESVEAFRCDKYRDRYFCSNNCLREYVLADLD